MSGQDAGDVESFSHLDGLELDDRPCQGLACFVARHRRPERWADAAACEPRVYCLGRCYAAPASAGEASRPSVESVATSSVVLERVRAGGAHSVDAYRRGGGFAALEQALAMSREAVVATIEASKLRGRGGAGFPAGNKWRSVFDQQSDAKYVVCNADEGDPGAYVDRFLLEDDPYCVLEAMTIAAYAVGAERGYVYVRREYSDAYESVRRAVADSRADGVLGAGVFGRGASFDVEVRRGKGSYVCGEETALLNAIEGRRPEVRARPPYPTVRGLFGRPTLVHNVETLANVPWIVRHGADAYAALGRGASRGTKVLSLSSLFGRPGLYEIDLGTPLSDVVGLAGGVSGGEPAGILVGGPLAGVVPPSLFHVPMTFEDLDAIGAALGHGGVVAFDDRTSILELAHQVFRFASYESCGKCTPCRVGSAEGETILARASTGRPLDTSQRDELTHLVHALGVSLCGHGAGLAEFAHSLVRHYPEVFDSCPA